MPAAGGAASVRLLGFNPLWATGSRLAVVCVRTKNMNAVMLAGTQGRSWAGGGILKRSLMGRLILEQGVENGPFTNRSAGCAVILGAKYRERDVKRTWPSPPGAAGRAMAVRVKQGAADYCFGVVYCPPRPRAAGAMPGYRRTVAVLTSWLDKLLSSLPQRTTPVIYMDANDGIGYTKEGNVWVEAETNAVKARTRERVKGGGAGEKVRECADKHYMQVANMQTDEVQMT